MKTRILLLLLAFPLLFASCSRRRTAEKPSLTVSIEPLRYVVEAVAGDRFEVHTLMPKGASPETYEPTPRQMVELGHGRLLFVCGTLGFEQTRLRQMAEATPGVETVALSRDVEPLAGAQGGDDPHIWMSPHNLTAMAAAACDALCRADSANAGEYRARLAAFASRMEHTDSVLSARVKPLRHRAFLIYHPALGHFARQYGLTQIAVEQDGREPSAARMRQLETESRAAGVKRVFVSEEHAGRAARRLARSVGARVVDINPLVYDVPTEMSRIADALQDD